MLSNIGSDNNAIGYDAHYFNTTGNNNTAMGVSAMGGGFGKILTTGSNNTATGATALWFDTTGSNNTANGYAALVANPTGNYNTADGQAALGSNGTGSNNTAVGQNALVRNSTGSNNIALGSNAGFQLTTGSNNIDIFDRGVAGEANRIRIGRQGIQSTTFIAGISGATVTGSAVVVNSSGQLGVAPSSQRFKKNIQTMGDASDRLLALRPVTFEYKPDIDSKGIPQLDLVAEEVKK